MHLATRLWAYYRPYRRVLAADLACALAAAAIALAFPLLIGRLTRLLQSGEAGSAQVLAVGGAMLALVALNAACSLFVDYRGHLMGTLMECDMRRDLFEHYQKLSFAFHDRQRTGQLMARLTHDLYNIGELAHHGPEDLAIALAKFAGVFAILVHIDLRLTALVYLFLLAMLAWALWCSGRMRRALRRMHRSIADINAQVEDTLAGIRVVLAFDNRRQEQREFEQLNQRIVDSMRASHKSEALFSIGIDAFAHLLSAGVVVTGGLAIVHASLSLADLLTCLLCIGILVDPIQRFVNVARLYQEGGTGFERFVEMMDIEPEIVDAPGAVELPRADGRVRLRDVGFRYNGGRDAVLQQLNLEIGAGEFVALVGPSGVGKTTLCSLIPRFYEASEGAVLLDDIDVRQIRLGSLRRHVGVVHQEVYLFAGTVRDNIRYGRLDASDAEVIEAARLAHAHEFVAALPQGYDTDIGQRGVKLSGGQRQRIAIARAFLKDPAVLILDEATSALDSESERAVQQALETLVRRRTTLVIAHRLSTVRRADRIVVLGDAGIVEQGSHDELIARRGAYARMHATQLRI